MQTAAHHPAKDHSRWWVRHAPWLLAIGLLSVRLAEQIFIGGYELAADEAQYWDWSRRLDGSYYTKGPGVAWAIAASTRLLGHAEWAVRLPSLLAWAGTVLVAAALAKRAVGPAARPATRERAAAFASVFAVCCPVLFAVGQFATIDAPYLFFWAVSAWCVMIALQRVGSGRIGVGWWAAAGLAVGVSFLFKYTALLVLPGVVGASVMAVVRYQPLRRPPEGSPEAPPEAPPDGPPDGPPASPPEDPPKRASQRQRGEVEKPGRGGAWKKLLAGWGVMLLAVAVAGLPVWWWNHVHGWPTVAHLLGHLGMEGGDIDVSKKQHEPAYHPLWTLGYLGAQLAVAGPGLWLLFALATRRLRWRWRAAVREPLAAGRNGRTRHREPAAHRPRPIAMLTLWWLFVTPLAFYLFVTFFADTEANWPVAGYATAVALAGAVAPRGWQRWQALRRRWRSLPKPRPKWGVVRTSPETPWQAGWHWTLGWGGVAIVGVVLGPLLLRSAPRVDAERMLKRVAGHEAWAASILDAVRSELSDEQLADAAWASDRYGEAALLAYYLPTRSSVHSISSLAGGRESSYDYFADTNLWRNELTGRPMIAVGGGPEKWENTLRFDKMIRVHRIDSNDAVFLLEGYRGPRADTPERDYAPGIGKGFW